MGQKQSVAGNDFLRVQEIDVTINRAVTTANWWRPLISSVESPFWKRDRLQRVDSDDLRF